MKSKSGKEIAIGDTLSGVDADGKTVQGILVQANNELGILLPKEKIGQSANDVGVEVKLADCSHVETPKS